MSNSLFSGKSSAILIRMFYKHPQYKFRFHKSQKDAKKRKIEIYQPQEYRYSMYVLTLV